MSNDALLQADAHGLALACHRTEQEEQDEAGWEWVELKGGKKKDIYLDPLVSPGRDDGPQVVDGLPQPVRLHHQIQLVILLWLTWQAKAGQLSQPLPQLPLSL